MSVVVESYNELQLVTAVTDVFDGLATQDYQLDRIELILVGSEARTSAALGRGALKPGP